MPEITDSVSTQSSPPLWPMTESPLDVLSAEARTLTQKTGNILIGDVITRRNDDATMLRLGMEVPAMDEGWQGLLDAIHPNDKDYPVWVHAPEFPGSQKLPPYHILTPEQEKEDFVAHGPEEFRRLIDRVLSSDEVRRLIAWYTQECKRILSKPEADEQP